MVNKGSVHKEFGSKAKRNYTSYRKICTEVEEKVDGFAPDSRISVIVSSVPFGEDHLDPSKSRLLVGGEWSREFDIVIGHDQASPEDFETDFRPPNAGVKDTFINSHGKRILFQDRSDDAADSD